MVLVNPTQVHKSVRIANYLSLLGQFLNELQATGMEEEQIIAATQDFTRAYIESSHKPEFASLKWLDDLLTAIGKSTTDNTVVAETEDELRLLEMLSEIGLNINNRLERLNGLIDNVLSDFQTYRDYTPEQESAA